MTCDIVEVAILEIVLICGLFVVFVVDFLSATQKLQKQGTIS